HQNEHTSSGDLGEPVPPFGCLWSTANGFHRVLAVVNEEGVVKLYETESRNRENPTLREWSAHNNAVFDVAWVPGEPKLVTASGDQTAKLWDVTGSELLGTFKGHQCSLKSVSFGDWEKAVFCTGGRDGNIMVWDTRCNKKDGFYRQVKQITGAHNALAKQTSPKQKKKRQTARGLAPSVDFQQSVTVVLFQDENTLISAGAVDGVIKVWDLRKHYSVHHQEPMPVRSFSYPGSSTRKLGYSNLILDSTGSNLFANCTDDNIYMFNLTGLRNAPVATFSGHQNSTFYVKSSLSPDGQFLLSGSSDNNAYIWKVSNPRQPPTVLQGHSQEVTSVTWCPSDFTKVSVRGLCRGPDCGDREDWFLLRVEQLRCFGLTAINGRLPGHRIAATSLPGSLHVCKAGSEVVSNLSAMHGVLRYRYISNFYVAVKHVITGGGVGGGYTAPSLRLFLFLSGKAKIGISESSESLLVKVPSRARLERETVNSAAIVTCRQRGE
uniref:Uncharacterized protein n=1 Tax=Callorhinchus milii TaxID=7868 RepID=A0A4W3IGX8_CALMI